MSKKIHTIHLSKKDIKKIMKFLGYEFITIGYYGGDTETKWQKNNEKWIDKVGIDSVGDYFVNMQKDDFIDLYNDNWEECINFEWNFLMKIIHEIETKGYRVTISTTFVRIHTCKNNYEDYDEYNCAAFDGKINAVKQAIVDFVKWYG